MKPLLSVFLGLHVIAAGQAEPVDERQKLALELVELISTNRPNEDGFQQKVAEQIERVIPQLKLSAEDSELFREAALGAAGTVTVERMIEAMAKAYAKKLSAKELEGIIGFYRTEAGKAWLREQAAIEAEKAAQQKALVAEVLEETRRRFKELKKRNPK